MVTDHSVSDSVADVDELAEPSARPSWCND